MRMLGRRISSGLLTLAALGGAVCLVLVPLAFAFHISLIMFKTGSMSPAIPQGSLAVVQRVPASTIHVGDVVTIDRPHGPPVTHRVTAIAPGPGDTRTITLRGDANPGNDPAPYVVSSVRRVLFSAPRLAYAVRAVSNPIVMGAITIAAAVLVTWAFWPRGESAPHLHHGPPRHAAGGPRHAATVSALVVVAVLAPVHRARADVTEHVVRGDVLTVTSIGDKALMENLKPGVPVPWQVGVAAHPARPTTVRISLTARGDLVADATGLHVTVRQCSVRWDGHTCATGATLLRGPGPASTLFATATQLTSMPSDEQRWILIDAALPANPETLPVGSATLVVTASGGGEDVTTGGSLVPTAATGSNMGRSIVIGLTALGAGLALTLLARVIGVRQRRRDEETS